LEALRRKMEKNRQVRSNRLSGHQIRPFIKLKSKKLTRNLKWFGLWSRFVKLQIIKNM
jgi:hypothetical protein